MTKKYWEGYSFSSCSKSKPYNLWITLAFATHLCCQNSQGQHSRTSSCTPGRRAWMEPGLLQTGHSMGNWPGKHRHNMSSPMVMNSWLMVKQTMHSFHLPFNLSANPGFVTQIILLPLDLLIRKFIFCSKRTKSNFVRLRCVRHAYCSSLGFPTICYCTITRFVVPHKSVFPSLSKHLPTRSNTENRNERSVTRCFFQISQGKILLLFGSPTWIYNN